MTDRNSLSFIHRFSAAETASRPPLLLLHGTGGDENDLLPLGRMIAPGVALLSPRGKVLENGMPRFFKRFAEGVLDEDDLRARAHELADFVIESGKHYGIASPIAVGFSNGANIAVAMLLLRPEAIAGAVLMRVMRPFAELPRADLGGKPILMLSGAADPLVPAAQAEQLAAGLKSAGAEVAHHVVRAGHGLTQDDVSLAANWIETKYR